MPSATGHSDSDSSDQDTRFDPDDLSVDSTSEGSSSYPLSNKPTINNPDPYSTPQTMNHNHHSKRHSSSPTTATPKQHHQATTPTTPTTPTLAPPSADYIPSDADDPPPTPTTPALPRRRPRRPLPANFETSRLSTLLLVVMTLASLGALAMMIDSWLHHQRDPIGCNQSYMRPSFVRQAGFDSEMTRFAGKYALYLYREKVYDNSDQPTGIPALFIPGHAGSYKQVRSIAAEAAVLYYDQMARELGAAERGVRGLDFFTVDFNEEFSALHGHSLLEQAEYLNDAISFILSLYPTTRRADPRTAKLPDPTSVVIIGHSMGGVVARTMFTMPNYQPYSINTIITMSTPHLLPPAPFDWKISRIYRDIYEFWRHGYSASGASAPAITPQGPVGMGVGVPHATHHPLSLSDVTLVSIAGGNLDNVVCSDTANIESIVPASHGFTMFTTGVPNVWVGSDHPAILWCNQLVKIVARSLLEVVDARQRGQTKPVEQRMAVFRKAFLSGLEEREPEAIGGNDLISLANLVEINTVLVHTSYRLSLDLDSAAAPTPRVYLLPIPRNTKPNTLHLDTFSLLTNQPVGRTQSFDLLLCTAAPNKPEPRPPNSPTGSWELPLAAASKLSCRPISDLVATVPASTVRDVFPFSGRTFKFLRLREPEWQGYHYVAIVDRGAASSADGFLVGEYYNEAENIKTIDTPLLDLLFHGAHLPRITPRTALLSAVHIPAIHNQFLTYKLRLRRPACPAREAKFTPFVRQLVSSAPSMYESKFHVNVKDDVEVDITFHGRVPFLERRSGEVVEKRGLVLQVWADPTCKGPVEIQIKIDWYGSLGRGLMRFTMGFACFPFITVVMVLRAQLQAYNQSGAFPHFGQGLSYVLRKTLPLFLTLVALCSMYQTTARGGASYSIGDFLSLDPTTSDKISTTASASFSFADVLIGNQDPFFWWLPPVLFVLCFGVAVMLWGFLSILVRALGFVVAFVGRRGPAVARLITRYWISSDIWPEGSVFWNRFFSNRCNARVDEIRFSDTSRRQESAIRRLQRRAITTLVLFVLVATFIPYQFAFVVAFLVHLVSCVRTVAKAINSDDLARSQRNWDRYHYMQSMLVLLFTLLPFTLPVLVVWIRNLSVQWFAPFSSDHSIFAIAPFMIYVEMLTGGKMLPRTPDVKLRFITNLILYGIIIYAFLYGVRYTHSLYFLSNGFVSWLVILHARESWVAKVAAVYVFEHLFRFQNKKRS